MSEIKLIEYKPEESLDMDKVRLAEAEIRLRQLTTKINYLEDELTLAKELKRKWQKRFMKYDRRMAERDGRLRVIPTGQSGKKKSGSKPYVQLTPEDIFKVMDQLGIKY